MSVEEFQKAEAEQRALEMGGRIIWMDAAVHTPSEDSLLLVVEHTDGAGRVADMVTGFYADGEYLIGTTTAGDSLAANEVVRYWAKLIWPAGYDENGIWQN